MLLQMHDVSRDFQREQVTVHAVSHVDLAVDTGEFVSIIGRSGSGKSTLLNMAVGLLSPTAGSICVDGQEIASLGDQQTSLLRNTKIGYVPQGQSTLSNLNVLDNVRLPFYTFKRAGDPTQRALHLLEQMGIAHLAKAYPSSLSGGELRRVAIARALINQPMLVVADEPTSDLDEENTQEVIRLFRQIADAGTAVLMVTHELDTTACSDRVLRMDGGRLSNAR